MTLRCLTKSRRERSPRSEQRPLRSLQNRLWGFEPRLVPALSRPPPVPAAWEMVPHFCHRLELVKKQQQKKNLPPLTVL